MAGILIADDDQDIRTLVRVHLQLHGLDVVAEATSGSEALEMWRASRPGVLVLDHYMPGLTGLQVAEAVLAEDPSASIVIFTAYARAGELEEVEKEGITVLDKTELFSLGRLVRGWAEEQAGSG